MLKVLLSVIVSFWLAFFSPLSHATTGLPLVDAAGHFNWAGHGEYRLDPQHSLTPEAAAAAQSGFLPVTGEAVVLGLTDAPAWFRIKLSNPSDDARRWYALLADGYINQAQAWLVSADGTNLPLGLSGHQTPYFSRPVPMPLHYLFPFTLPAHTEACLVLRVNGHLLLHPKLSLWSVNDLLANEQRECLLLGLLFGAYALVLLHNLILFATVRDRVYLYFAALVLGLGLYQAGREGLAWPLLVFDWGEPLAQDLFRGVVVVAAVAFGSAFLELPKRMPKLFRAWLACGAAVAVLSVLGLWLPWFNRASLLASILCGLLLIVTATLSGWRGVRLAWAFLLSWLPLILSNWHLTAVAFGLLPDSDGLFELRAHQFAGVVTVTCFSLILGTRLATLRQAKLLAEESNRAKTLFLNELNHELRAPMQGMLGYAELLGGEVKTPRGVSYLEGIVISGEAMLAALDDSINFSRIDAGQVDLQRKPVNVATIIREVQVIFRPKADLQGLNMRTQVDQAIPKALLLDSTRIRQILSNLVGNAIKFTKHGEIRISADWSGEAESHTGLLSFCVSDTGMGISAEDQKRVFEPYFRSAAAAGYAGTGMGLAIVQGLVTALGGRLEIESDVGKGTEICVYLPHTPVAEGAGEPSRNAPGTPTASPADEGGTPPKPGLAAGFRQISTRQARQSPPPATPSAATAMPPKANVLIVDDVPVNRKLFMGFLRGLPLRCLEAENADQALEICRTHLVDLVITDIRMPGMDGFELSRLIRKSGIPVIGVTADARPHVMAQLEREFDTFLVKPLPQKTLVDNVTRLLPVALNDLVSRTHDSFEQYARRLWASLPEYPSLDELENFALSLAELAAQFSRHALAKDAKVAAGLCQEFRMEEALQWLQTLRVGQGHASRQPSDAASAGISEGIARR